MVRPYSLDLRVRVVAAVAGGQRCRAVAETFGVSVASVVKWSQRFRTTGSPEAKPMGGKRPFALEAERDWLLKRIAEAPDITLRALAAEIGERGVAVSHYAVWNLLAREGITFKKKPARQRTGQARRRPPPVAMATASGKI